MNVRKLAEVIEYYGKIKLVMDFLILAGRLEDYILGHLTKNR